MSLTSKQIDELRAYAKDRKGEIAKLVSDAADTIELLSAKLSAANMERSSQYYHDGWIPVTERLPKDHEPKLLTHEVHYLTGKVIKDVRMAYYDDENDNWLSDEESPEILCYPLAWMPLPEPYKAEQDTSDMASATERC